jgi:hypothetical protein
MNAGGEVVLLVLDYVCYAVGFCGVLYVVLVDGWMGGWYSLEPVFAELPSVVNFRLL